MAGNVSNETEQLMRAVLHIKDCLEMMLENDRRLSNTFSRRQVWRDCPRVDSVIKEIETLTNNWGAYFGDDNSEGQY